MSAGARARRPRLGLLGGSFDPIHKGHLAMAAAAERALALDRVYFVPARAPWQKPELQTPFEDRYAMVALALQHHPRWLPLSLTAAGRASTTLAEVGAFRRRFAGAEVYLILGADAFAGIASWRRWRALLGACDFIVLARAGWSWPAIAAQLPRGTVAGAPPELRLAGKRRLFWIANFRSPVSSTLTRRQLAAARSAGVPAAVGEYARRAGLFAGTRSQTYAQL